MMILLPLLFHVLGCGQVCSLEATDACPGKVAGVLIYWLVLPGAVCASTKLWETQLYVFALMYVRRPFLMVYIISYNKKQA